jgi:hypothetical protein
MSTRKLKGEALLAFDLFFVEEKKRGAGQQSIFAW